MITALMKFLRVRWQRLLSRAVPHLPDYVRKIEEFDSRTGGSESPQAENDRISRARWWIDDWHC